MRLRAVAPLSLCVVLCACPRREVPPPGPVEQIDAPADGACRMYATSPVEVGRTPEALAELSGLVASRTWPEVFWAHNDSGNDTELFAIRASGEVLARFPLANVEGRDIEDVALGPCAPGAEATCVFLADIGDNLRMRDDVALLRLLEPDPVRPGALQAERLRFRYPDGAHNAESLVVDRDGTPYVITKTGESLGDVYRLEGLAPGATGSATKVATLKTKRLRDATSTGADLHPSAVRLIVRTYGRVWEFRGGGATSLLDLFEEEGVEIPAASQIQSEAVAYLPDGGGYLLGSEGRDSPIYRVDCRP